jgi:hypothetical protein
MPKNDIKLQVQNSGLYLSAPLSNNASGTNATQETDPTSDNSTWEMIPQSGANADWFLLKVKSSGLYLNIANSGMNNGDVATLENLPSPVTDNFLWKKVTIQASPTWCFFQVKHSSQYLNIEGLGKEPGINACQGLWNSTPNFYWLEQPKDQWKDTITIDMQIDCPTLIDLMPQGGVINSENANATLVFSDDNKVKGNSGNNQIDFESIVNPGNTVVWKAKKKPGNGNYSVGVDDMIYDNGSGTGNIFSELDEKGNSGIVSATVLWTAIPPANDGDNETYTVHFTVTPKNSTPISYSVDPKLKVRPTTLEAK